MKICTKCNASKPLDQYSVGRRYCKECGREMCRQYKANNRGKIAEYNKEYKQEHKEELSVYNSSYHQEHKERVYERHAVNIKKYKEKKKDDEGFKKIERIRATIRTYIKGETKTNKYIGCSREFLLKWVNFCEPSFTVDNYGKEGWCLDHVIACCKFNPDDDNDITRCFHWTNGQPLTFRENSKKHQYLKKEELDKHMHRLNTFLEKEEIKELILKENIVIPDFDRYQYIDV